VSEIRLGSINGSHGVKGWVKVFSYTDPVEAILDYQPWILKKGSITRQVNIQEGQPNGKKLIARLEDVDTREMSDELIGYEIFVDREVLPDLEDGVFYWFQLEGLTVRNTDGVLFGQVDQLLETGANDVLVVKPTADSIDDEERLIPYVKHSSGR
jgi:16S rRNA processing protein RimM